MMNQKQISAILLPLIPSVKINFVEKQYMMLELILRKEKLTKKTLVAACIPQTVCREDVDPLHLEDKCPLRSPRLFIATLFNS